MTRRDTGVPAPRRMVAAGVVAAVLLGACSSAPPTRFHTLMPAAASTAPQRMPAGPLAWEVLPVAIPAQVDQPQWVLRTADGSLAVLEQERWIAPLGEELRSAVAERLTQLLGASAPSAVAEPGQHWRVRIDVQRFEGAPGREARLEATWGLSSGIAGAVAFSCRGEFAQAPTSASYPAMAQAYRLAVAALADAIGAALKALSAGQPASCAG